MAEGSASESVYPDRPAPRPNGPGTSHGGRGKPDSTDVFCGDRSNQPETLMETEHFFVVPDLYPITPGHMLIVPKKHYPSYGATPRGWDREIQTIVAHMQQFLQDAYGIRAMVWENGGPSARQSVHHAHMHLIPMPNTVTALPTPHQAVPLHGDGFNEIRAWWRSQAGGRPYHIMELGNDRRLLPTGSQDYADATAFKGIVLNVETTPDGRSWVRRQNPLEVARTLMLFRRWELSHPLPRYGPAAPDRGLAA